MRPLNPIFDLRLYAGVRLPPVMTVVTISPGDWVLFWDPFPASYATPAMYASLPTYDDEPIDGRNYQFLEGWSFGFIEDYSGTHLQAFRPAPFPAAVIDIYAACFQMFVFKRELMLPAISGMVGKRWRYVKEAFGELNHFGLHSMYERN